VAEQKDVLCAFFGILSLGSYWNYVSSTKGESPFTNRHYRRCLLWFAFGLMSKPMLVTLPCVFLLLDYWPLRRIANPTFQTEMPANLKLPQLPQWTFSRLFVEKLPFFALTIVSCVLTFFAQRSAGAVASTDVFPLTERLGHVVDGYARYCVKMLLPTRLAIFYPMVRPLPGVEIFLSLLLLGVITFFAVKFRHRRPYLVTGWFWFLGVLVPTIGLVQVGGQSIADRYTYLPLIGLFIMMAWALHEFSERLPARQKLIQAAICVAVAGCLVGSWLQARYWTGTIRLFTHAENVTLPNEAVEAILGGAYADMNRLPEARKHAEKAFEIDPNHPEVVYLMGKIAAYEGRKDDAQGYFEKTLKFKPNYAAAHYSLANLLVTRGQLAEATNHYESALRNNPEVPLIEYTYAVTLVRMAEREPSIQAKGPLMVQAANHLKAALRLRPEYPEALDELGTIETKLGAPKSAQSRYEMAIAIDPKFTHARLKLAFLLASQQKFDEASAQLTRVIQLEPTNFLGHFNLAGVFEAQGQTNQALAEFLAASKIDPADTETQLRVAAILTGQNQPEAAEAIRKSAGLLARDGRFAEAIEACRKALKLKPDSPETLANLAWLLATAPDDSLRNGPEAVTLAKRAGELGGPNDARYLMPLDAAYAEVGQFADAIKTATAAHDAAFVAKQFPLVEAATKRLELYRAGKPFHQPLKSNRAMPVSGK